MNSPPNTKSTGFHWFLVTKFLRDRLMVAVSRCRTIAQMESPCAASSAATMTRVRVSMPRAYSGLSDFYGDKARSCCRSLSLACCAGVSV